jgi:hypothetical protein
VRNGASVVGSENFSPGMSRPKVLHTHSTLLDRSYLTPRRPRNDAYVKATFCTVVRNFALVACGPKEKSCSSMLAAVRATEKVMVTLSLDTPDGEILLLVILSLRTRWLCGSMQSVRDLLGRSILTTVQSTSRIRSETLTIAVPRFDLMTRRNRTNWVAPDTSHIRWTPEKIATEYDRCTRQLQIRHFPKFPLSTCQAEKRSLTCLTDTTSSLSEISSDSNYAHGRLRYVLATSLRMARAFVEAASWAEASRTKISACSVS